MYMTMGRCAVLLTHVAYVSGLSNLGVSGVGTDL